MAFVKGQPRRRYAGLIACFAVAFFTSATVVYAVARSLGAAVRTAEGTDARAFIAASARSAAVLLDAYSVRHKTWCPISLHRQTPKEILLAHGPQRAVIARALDTGTVFSTYRVSAISWALLLLALAGIAPWWIGVAYAGGFTLPLAAGCMVSAALTHPSEASRTSETLVLRSQIARGACIAGLAVVAAMAWTVVR